MGLIGVGRMGLPICARLVESGYEVVATDLRPERNTDVRAAGAVWSRDTRSVAAAADVAITVLPGSSELQAAMGAARSALRPGALWIDMTTAAPAVGGELAARAQEAGVACLDAPVGGSPAAAATGRLRLFVGGPAETVERHRRLLETLGTIQHVGDNGAGYTTKLLVNLLWFGQAVAAGEALLLARRAGIDLELLRGVLMESAAANEFIRRDLCALFTGDYLETFGLDRCCEELDAVVDLAHEMSVPFDLSTAVQGAYRRALARYGRVDGELLAVAYLEDQAGVRLRTGRHPPSRSDPGKS